MCAIADYLRLELYKASIQYKPTVMSAARILPDDEALAAIRLNQSEQPHQGALQALREHLQNCEECKNGHA